MNRFHLLALAATLASASATSTASASTVFPPEIATHLGVSCTPQCTVCHQTLAGGAGTATTPFASGMKARGLASGNLASLDTALDQIAADKYDSNGDGVNDVDELKKCADPNAGVDLPPAPGYGCAAARGTSGRSAVALALAGLGLALARRRRR